MTPVTLPTSTQLHPGSAARGTVSQAEPSPALLFDTINAYQRTAAIKAAVELDLFTALADVPGTAESIAELCEASPRGIRILCDYLTLLGFLAKDGARYSLTPDSAAFLSRKSPAYAGGTLEFLLSNEIRASFDGLKQAVAKGGTAQSDQGTLEPNHPLWMAFARNMGPLMVPAAAGLANLVRLDAAQTAKVLDISASHGIWGLAFARKYPRASVVAVDWAPVLEVATANARASGLENQFSTIAGDAFNVEFGSDYDVVLIPNFLHHFDPEDCIKFLKKTRAALRPGGTVAIVEFVPNPDRVSPPAAAGFSLVMLATTPAGDAYTFDELADMLAGAGFHSASQHPLPASMNAAIVAQRA